MTAARAAGPCRRDSRWRWICSLVRLGVGVSPGLVPAPDTAEGVLNPRPPQSQSTGTRPLAAILASAVRRGMPRRTAVPAIRRSCGSGSDRSVRAASTSPRVSASTRNPPTLSRPSHHAEKPAGSGTRPASWSSAISQSEIVEMTISREVPSARCRA